MKTRISKQILNGGFLKTGKADLADKIFWDIRTRLECPDIIWPKHITAQAIRNVIWRESGE